MTAGCDQHEAVPYCALERQLPPKVKSDPDGIKHAPSSNQKRGPRVSTAASMGRAPTRIIHPSVR